MKLLQIKGSYKNVGIVELENNRIIEWKVISEEKPPELPLDISIELIISFEMDELLIGKNGIVWAAYDKRQVEVIQNALLAQHINSEIKMIINSNASLYLIKIVHENEVNFAMEFIWKSKSGLRLKPDWSYSKGEPNKSFEQWLNEQ